MNEAIFTIRPLEWLHPKEVGDFGLKEVMFIAFGTADVFYIRINEDGQLCHGRKPHKSEHEDSYCKSVEQGKRLANDEHCIDMVDFLNPVGRAERKHVMSSNKWLHRCELRLRQKHKESKTVARELAAKCFIAEGFLTEKDPIKAIDAYFDNRDES